MCVYIYITPLPLPAHTAILHVANETRYTQIVESLVHYTSKTFFHFSSPFHVEKVNLLDNNNKVLNIKTIKVTWTYTKHPYNSPLFVCLFWWRC